MPDQEVDTTLDMTTTHKLPPQNIVTSGEPTFINIDNVYTTTRAYDTTIPTPSTTKKPPSTTTSPVIVTAPSQTPRNRLILPQKSSEVVQVSLERLNIIKFISSRNLRNLEGG